MLHASGAVVTPPGVHVLSFLGRLHVQGSLRDQLLYPKLLPQWWSDAGRSPPSADSEETPLLLDWQPSDLQAVPTDGMLADLLRTLGLSHLLQPADAPGDDAVAVPMAELQGSGPRVVGVPLLRTSRVALRSPSCPGRGKGLDSSA